MKARQALWCAMPLLLYVANPAAAAPPAAGGTRFDCEEMEECFVEGLDLSDDQQREVRDLMETGRKKQDELRDETYHRIRDVLTPEQGRKLEEHRSDILKYRAQRLRRQAEHMEQRARQLRDAH